MATMHNNDKGDNRKTVLMICYDFTPHQDVGALRSTKYAKYLGDYGWSCEVITAYSGKGEPFRNKQKVVIHQSPKLDVIDMIIRLVPAVYWCIRFAKRAIFFLKRKVKPVNVNPSAITGPVEIRGGMGIATALRDWLSVPDGKLLWIIWNLPLALWIARKCDVIYSSHWPCSAHVLGLILKKITGKPWIADYRDEWSLNCRWYPRTRFHRWLGVSLDNACVRNADIVVNVTEPRTKMFVEHFNEPADKFVTIANGYDTDDVIKYRVSRMETDILVMTSIGSLVGGRDARPFLRVVAQLLDNGMIDRNRLRISFIGGLYADLQSEIEKLGISDFVTMLPRIPQQQAFMKLAESHVAILVGSDMEKVAMTTKVYEYAGMGKPIFALAPDGPLKDFVEKCQGWCAQQGNVDEIKTALMEIIRLFQDGRLGNNYISPFVESFDRFKLASQLAECLDRCLRRG